MKRFFILLLVFLVLIALTSCDPSARAKLADMMGSLGGNVMGSDTSSVDKAVSASSKIEEGATAEVGSDGSVTIAGVTVHNIDEGTVYISSVSEEKKAEIVSGIADAKKNEASLSKLQQEMAKPADETDAVAVKGTAGIVQSAIKSHLENADEQVKKAIEPILAGLNKMSGAEETITKADVAAVQMAVAFADAVQKNLEENGNTLTVDSTLINEANQLLVVLEAVYPDGNSRFEIDFGSLISDFINGSSSSDGSGDTGEEQ